MDLFKRVQNAGFGTFSESVLYLPREGENAELRGIYSSKFNVFEPEMGEIEISSSTPTVDLKNEDLEAENITIADGDSVVIREINYLVKDFLPDGEGITKLVLLQDNRPNE